MHSRYLVVWVTKFREHMLPGLLLIKSMAVNGFVRQFPSLLVWVWLTTHDVFRPQSTIFPSNNRAVLAFSVGHDLSNIIGFSSSDGTQNENMFSPPQIQTKAGNLKHNITTEMRRLSEANTTWIDHVWLPWLLSRSGVPRLDRWRTRSDVMNKKAFWTAGIRTTSVVQPLEKEISAVLYVIEISCLGLVSSHKHDMVDHAHKHDMVDHAHKHALQRYFPRSRTVWRRNVSAIVAANVLYEKACFWDTSKVRLKRMFAWSVFSLSSWGPEDIVVSLFPGVWKFLVRQRPRVRKYDLWRFFLLCGSQPRSVRRRLNDILTICTAQIVQ